MVTEVTMQREQNMLSKAVAFTVALAIVSLVGASLLSDDSSGATLVGAIALGTMTMFALARLLAPMFTRKFVTMALCRDFRLAAIWVGWNAFPRGMRALSS